MRELTTGLLPIGVIASLVMAIVLLLLRITVMQRVQRSRQRENRSENERLRALIAAYRALAGSFSPASEEQRPQVEEALADLVLFGTVEQVELASACVRRLQAEQQLVCDELVANLRAELRDILDLEPLPKTLALPETGPGRERSKGEGNARGEGRGAGARGGGGGGGAGGGGAGGMGAGLLGGGVGAGLSGSSEQQ